MRMKISFKLTLKTDVVMTKGIEVSLLVSVTRIGTQQVHGEDGAIC